MNIRTECAPRIIKRINIKEKIDDASKYAFYRQINHLSIMMLDNETDKMNYSSWLTRLDSETSDLKMHLIKILFVSLRSDKSFQMFLKPPPDDLKDLELRSDNTMDMVQWLQDHNIPDESLTNEEKKQEIKHKRSAAVATNMLSYTSIKTSPYFVQSFYVRSDWPIYTWYNPTSILLPSSFDHNQWELFLNRFQIVTEDKKSSKHRNECDDIIPIDQISNEPTTTFNWHPYSILASEENRPKRTAGSIVIDLDIANQQCNQQQIDDAALAIVFCKLFPGNKTISQKMYTDTLIPDKKFIFKMTGVTLVDYSNVKLKQEEKLPFTCILKEIKPAVKNSCEVKKVKTLCPCEKPMMTINCSKPQLPCSAQNAKEIIQTRPSSNIVNTENDCKSSNQNTTHQECKSNSKCLKRSVKKIKSVESCKFPKEDDDFNVINDNNCGKNRSTVLSAGGSSFNGSSNCDWTMSGVEANCTSISSGRVARVEPEDLQSASRHYSSCNCSVQKAAAEALTFPRQSPQRTAVESVREPPREHHHGRGSLGNREVVNSERTVENGGRADAAIFDSGRRRTSPAGQRTSVPEPLDRCSASRIRQPCPAKDLQNRSFPAQSCRVVPSSAFAEHRPPRRPDTTFAASVSSSCSDRSGRGSLQQQHEFAGPSGDNRSDTAWDPEVGGGYSAFSATIRSRASSPSPQPLPANDFHIADDGNNDDLSDDCGSGATGRDWPADAPGIDQRPLSWTRVMWANRSRDDDDDNNNYADDDNNNYGDAACSLSALTNSSSNGSIELRRTDDPQQPWTSDDERYPSNLSDDDDNDVSLQREDAVNVPGSLVTWPWTSSTRSGPRVREFGDVRAPDRYDGTSCSSDGGDASTGRDDFRGGSETDDDCADAAPLLQHRRNY